MSDELAVASSALATVNTEGPVELLAALVRNLEMDPAESRHRIRELLDESPQTFLAAAVQVIKQQAEARGARFVASLLVSSGLILPALCDSSLTHDQALAMARLATRPDATREVILGRASADRVASSRIIRMLEHDAGGKDQLSLLLRMLRQSNPYLRSKAVLMLARTTRNVGWVRKMLADADPRIRANAVEALWGVNTAEARELLDSLTNDPHNRVAGNALLGLYRLGDAGVIPEILRMAAHEAAAFRATAAWIMGATGHPRFTEALSELLKDPDALPRKGAIAGLGRLRKAAAQARMLPTRRIAAHFVHASDPRGARRVALAVAPLHGAETKPLLPTNICLSEDGRPVHRYQVAQAEAEGRCSVVFILPVAESGAPNPWNHYVSACLSAKRRADAWSCLTYASGVPQSGDAAADEGEPRFEQEESLIRDNLAAAPLLPTRTDVWHAIWRSAKPGQDGIAAGKHLIICNDSRSDRAPGSGLIASLLASRSRVQVVSSVPNQALEDLCRQVHGVFLPGRNPHQIAALVELACLNLQVHHEITYEPTAPNAGTLKVVLCHPSGWGEVSIPIPQRNTEA